MTYAYYGGIAITKETFSQVAETLQNELIDLVKIGNKLDDYQIILYNYLFTKELDFPTLHIEIKENHFILYVVPDDLSVKHLRLIDDTFDKFELTFLENSQENSIRLKFTYKGE